MLVATLFILELQLLQGPFKQALALQKEKLHRKSGGGGGDGDSTPLLGQIFEKLVLAMVAYFIVSILNSLAQSYHKRINKEAVAGSKKANKAGKAMWKKQSKVIRY